MKYRNDLWLFSMIRICISKLQTYNVHELVDCAATAVDDGLNQAMQFKSPICIDVFYTFQSTILKLKCVAKFFAFKF